MLFKNIYSWIGRTTTFTEINKSLPHFKMMLQCNIYAHSSWCLMVVLFIYSTLRRTVWRRFSSHTESCKIEVKFIITWQSREFEKCTVVYERRQKTISEPKFEISVRSYKFTFIIYTKNAIPFFVQGFVWGSLFYFWTVFYVSLRKVTFPVSQCFWF